MFKTFLLKLKVLFELITTVICTYVAIVGTFSSLLFNFIFFIIAIFTLSQALGTVDIINGNGQQPDAGNPDNQNPENPDNDNDDTGNPDSSTSDNNETQDSSSTENDTIEFIIDDNHDNIDDGVEENDTFNHQNNDYPEIPE